MVSTFRYIYYIYFAFRTFPTPPPPPPPPLQCGQPFNKMTLVLLQHSKKNAGRVQSQVSSEKFRFPAERRNQHNFLQMASATGERVASWHQESYFSELRAFLLANGFNGISLRTPLINQIMAENNNQSQKKEEEEC